MNENQSIFNTNCFPCVNHNLKPSTKFINPDAIITEVCNYLGVSVGRIIGNKRTAKLVNARHLIADILYRDRFLNMSMAEIGRLLGGRDHSSIVHAVKKITDYCETDEQFREQYRKLFIFLYDSDNYFLYTDKYFEFMKNNNRKKQKFIPKKVKIKI